MTKEILINRTSTEIRLALVEDAELQTIVIDRGESQSLVGNIYKAKVLRVMPGMQAAFVDIGEERSAFLPIDDILRASSGDKISDILRPGQDLLVQVVKDPVNKKGALLTTDFSIASKYLVYRHGRKKSGVSMQIKDKTERDRLHQLILTATKQMDRPETFKGNFILRSVAEGLSANQLDSEIKFLLHLWQSLSEKKLNKAPFKLYQEFPLYKQVIRDMLGLTIDRIRVDCSELLKELTVFCSQIVGSDENIFELHSAKCNLFDHCHIERQIKNALNLSVSLSCGGYLVIEETEALTAIDVNTGSYIGAGNDHQTYLEVNLEAAVEAARQIRLRNISGIIIIDFIDMAIAEHRHQVLVQLKQVLAKDAVKTMTCDFTELGLVQIARKRSSQSLSALLCEPCSHCQSKGVVKSEETISYEILRELLKINPADLKSVEVYAAASIVQQLHNKHIAKIGEIEKNIGCKVNLCTESSVPVHQFNIIQA
mgnify:CR=1 FL=1